MKSFYCPITITTECCSNCRHYQQHYAANALGYTPIYDGHCMYPRIKHRKPYDVCEHFKHILGPQDKEASAKHHMPVFTVDCTK